MKGVVFTEFLELVEHRFGLEVVDRIIEESDLGSGGAYTSVGTYDYLELLQLVSQLGRIKGMPVSALVRTFGRHLFHRFAIAYPHFWDGIQSAPEFLSKVQGFIHLEVLKLYPDANLPRIEFRELDCDTWELRYASTRPFADLASGLIDACIRHFGGGITVQRDDLGHQDGTAARFLLQRKPALCRNPSEVAACPTAMF